MKSKLIELLDILVKHVEVLKRVRVVFEMLTEGSCASQSLMLAEVTDIRFRGSSSNLSYETKVFDKTNGIRSVLIHGICHHLYKG